MRTLALVLSLTLPAATVSADEHQRRNDHDAARDAVERGERVPLATVVADALHRHPGKLIEAEYDDGEYEIEILREDGVVIELEYDARNGALRRTEVEDEDEDD